MESYMNGEWCYFHNYFSEDECESIIDLAKKTINPQQATMGDESRDASYINDYRKSEIRWIYPTMTEFEFVFDKMWKMAVKANDEFFNFHMSRLNYLQFACYNEKNQGEYKRHHDVFWMNKDSKYHRKLSATVQLSDPSTYIGGNFEIYNVQEKIDENKCRDQGTAIFFPSFYDHAVTPVTNGERCSLVAWFEGPKWR